MSTYYIAEVYDDFYMECLGLDVMEQTPSVVYVNVPLYGMVSIKIETPVGAVGLGVRA